ncbi:MAG: cysteine desulfurase family protein [Polyangiaceae bacterium]
MSQGRIYLDYNASTPIAAEVRDAMAPFLAEAFGNPSSGHWAGAPAAEALERAREHVASLLAVDTGEVVFTSGGSESSNWDIKGVVLRHLREHRDSRPKIVTTAVEHPATVEPSMWLQAFGARLEVVPVDAHGRVDPDDVAAAIDGQTVLVSVMHANNEVGTIQPVAAIAEVAHERGVLVHCDAAQSVGKIPVHPRELGADLLSVAGHKLYGPKGVGALYVREGLELDALIHGGGHERGRRAGTENVLYAVGLGAACELAEREPCAEHLATMRDRLWNGIGERPDVRLHGHPTERLPNTLNVGFVGRLGTDVLAALDGVAASTGSACHAGETTMSPVLAAMGVPVESGLGAVRFSTGRMTTPDQIDAVLARLEQLPVEQTS